MKDLNLLVWLTQLGLSTAFPLLGFVFLAVWLRNTFQLGSWVVWAGIILGLIMAFDGFRTSLKAMSRLTKSNPKQEEPPVSFNDHN